MVFIFREYKEHKAQSLADLANLKQRLKIMEEMNSDCEEIATIQQNYIYLSDKLREVLEALSREKIEKNCLEKNCERLTENVNMYKEELVIFLNYYKIENKK